MLQLEDPTYRRKLLRLAQDQAVGPTIRHVAGCQLSYEISLNSAE